MSIDDKAQDATTASTSFNWNAITVAQSIAIFVLAGFAEILGGWLIWVAIKGVRVEEEVVPNTTDDSNNDLSPDENVEPSDSPVSRSSQYIILKKPWYFALLGSLTLVAYGFIPCLQPSAASDGFARIYAAYGGFFIVLSYLLGWALEGESAKPDVGDLVGGAISLVGVGVIMFWPRD
jgi:small multidrug resistance family-3 protein